MIINADSVEMIRGGYLNTLKNPVIVTDPPFNIGYHYKGYKDRLSKAEYLNMLYDVLKDCPSVVVHYPEDICEIAIRLGIAPTKIISWVYPSNTAKQHRDIAYWKIKPDMNKVKQPYKNPTDKRIKERIAKGCIGARLYDWWEVNQVKNVSKKTISHPCVMPLEVMERIVGVLPNDITIVDPFCGSGTTGVACKKLGIDFIGIEINPDYAELSRERIESFL